MQVENPGVKSLDKFSTLKGQSSIFDKLCKVQENVIDGSGMGAKVIKEQGQTLQRHKRKRLSKDIWHKQATLKKKWSKIIKRAGNEELAAKIPGVKIARHWWVASIKCRGKPMLMKEIWMNAAKHWHDTRELSGIKN